MLCHLLVHRPGWPYHSAYNSTREEIDESAFSASSRQQGVESRHRKFITTICSPHQKQFWVTKRQIQLISSFQILIIVRSLLILETWILVAEVNQQKWTGGRLQVFPFISLIQIRRCSWHDESMAWDHTVELDLDNSSERIMLFLLSKTIHTDVRPGSCPRRRKR